MVIQSHIYIYSFSNRCFSHTGYYRSLSRVPCTVQLDLYFFDRIGFLRGASGKEPSCQSRRHKRRELNRWSGRSPGGGHGNRSSTLVWKIPRTEEPMNPTGSQRVRHEWTDLAHARTKLISGEDYTYDTSKMKADKCSLDMKLIKWLPHGE